MSLNMNMLIAGPVWSHHKTVSRWSFLVQAVMWHWHKRRVCVCETIMLAPIFWDKWMTFTYLINLTANERDGEHLCESACGVRLCLCVQSINPVFRDSPSLLPAHHFPTLEAVSQHHHTFHRAVTCCCRGNRLLFSFFCLSDHGIKCHFVWVAVDPLVTNTNTHTKSEAHVPLTHVCTDKPFCLPHS